MAESHVVTGLVATRAELAGRIEQCHRELERLVADVSCLANLIEVCFGIGLLAHVRVILPGKLAIGALDLVLSGVARDPHDLEIVFVLHYILACPTPVLDCVPEPSPMPYPGGDTMAKNPIARAQHFPVRQSGVSKRGEGFS